MKNGPFTGNVRQVCRCNKLQKDCFSSMKKNNRRPAAAKMLRSVFVVSASAMPNSTHEIHFNYFMHVPGMSKTTL